MTDTAVTIEILGKEYAIKCQDAELAALRQSAQELGARMQQVLRGAKTHSLERTAVVIALNLTHELKNLKQNFQQTAAKLSELEKKIDASLARSNVVKRQLPLVDAMVE